MKQQMEASRLAGTGYKIVACGSIGYQKRSIFGQPRRKKKQLSNYSLEISREK